MPRLLLCCAVFLLLSFEARAMCKEDLQELKPRIERIKVSNKERYALASKWWKLANDAEPTNELQCHNYYLRASKALSQPLEEVQNCLGPNTQLARCAKGAPPAALNADRGPVGPATQAPPPHFFIPPGSVGSTVPPFK